MDKLAQEDHSYRLSRDEFQRYQKHWYLTKKFGQECNDATSIRLPSRSHNHEPSPTEKQEKNVQNLFLFNNIRDGTILPQVIHGGSGTRPKAGGAHELNSFFKNCLLQ